jgi:hypothetical protein
MSTDTNRCTCLAHIACIHSAIFSIQRSIYASPSYTILCTDQKHTCQVILSSSSAGQCGSTLVCDPVVPITDMSLDFDNPAPNAGDGVSMDVDMLIAVPIPESETIEIGLPGFTSTSVGEFQFDTATFQTDPAFLTTAAPTVPAWKLIGCIKDSLFTR